MAHAFLADDVYPRLPVFLQNLACSYSGWREERVRFGAEFRRRLADLTGSENWSASEIEAFQNERLHAMIRHAYDAVPFYRERMQAHGLSPQDVRCREDLPKLPILTKEDVRQNLEWLVARNSRRKDLIRRHTSGTTGKSLHFYSTPSSLAFQWAVWWRHRRRFGIDFGTWHANFTGKLVVPPAQERPPYWRWNRPMRQALIPMQHLTPGKIEAITSFLGRQEFPLYTGYPSIIHAFVVAAKERGLSAGSPPRVISTGAENVLDAQRRDIESFFGSRLTDQYGFSEGCGNASECPESVYHEDFEFGILEAVDPAETDGGRTRARIVCTGFACPEFPLIRYDVGDVGVWEASSRACRCGRQSRVLARIEGRMDDYVLTPEGNRIMRFDYVFKDTSNIKESQVVQDKLGEITVRVVRRPSYGTADEALVTHEIARWISPALRVRFDYVDEIEREANGKFRAVKSLVRS